MIRTVLAASAATLLLAGAAAAQTYTSGPTAAPNDAKAADTTSAGQQGANSFSDPPLEPPAASTGPSASTGQSSNVVATEQMTPDGRRIYYRSSPTPANQAYALKAGDSTVVSNGPVPDTPENRAKYGGPDSHGGRATQARGN